MDQTIQDQPPARPQPVGEQQTTVQPTTQPEDGQEVVTMTPPETPPKPFPKIIVIAGGLLVLFIAGGAITYFLLQKPQPKPTSLSPAPTQPVETVSHYVGSQTIGLRDLQEGNLSGTATRTITATLSSHSIQANLTDPPDGSAYQFWIVKDQEVLGPMGTFAKNQDGQYIATSNRSLQQTDSFSFDDLYNTIVVSLETKDDGVMETKVLEGTFTQ